VDAVVISTSLISASHDEQYVHREEPRWRPEYMPVHRAEPRWTPLSSRPRSSRLRSMSSLYTERSRGGGRTGTELRMTASSRLRSTCKFCTPSGAEVMGCSHNLIQIHHARLHVYPTLLRRHILCRKHKKSQSENTSTHVR
jgi:hypothetical protein